MALAGARSSAGRLSEWTMPPHPLPARLRVAERAHGVVDGRVRALGSLELGDPALQLGNLPLGGLQLAAEERVRRLQVLTREEGDEHRGGW